MNVKKYTHKILAYSNKLFNEYLQRKFKKNYSNFALLFVKLSSFSQLMKGHVRASWLQIYCLQ